MDEQALNKKLAEWAGLEIHTENTPIGKPEMWVCSNCDYQNVGWIDFPNSLDACFKWLVPKLNIERITFYSGKGSTLCDLILVPRSLFDGSGKNPALALCLAIEKLIDGKK